MLKLRRALFGVLPKALPDAANLAAGAMVFGQTLSDRPLSMRLLVAGVGAWVSLIALAAGVNSWKGRR